MSKTRNLTPAMRKMLRRLRDGDRMFYYDCHCVRLYYWQRSPIHAHPATLAALHARGLVQCSANCEVVLTLVGKEVSLDD